MQKATVQPAEGVGVWAIASGAFITIIKPIRRK
jgi:hypothetical protein